MKFPLRNKAVVSTYYLLRACEAIRVINWEEFLFFFTCAQAIGRGTSHNLRRVFFFFFFFCIMFPPLENGQIAQ